jgi:DNA processing protein
MPPISAACLLEPKGGSVRKAEGIVGPARGPGIRLTEAQRLEWLRLIRTESVGPRTFQALINRFGGATAALNALPALARQRLGKPVSVCTVAEAEREMRLAEAAGGRFVAIGEPDYPAALAAADDAPPLIGLIGKAAILSRPAVAIVGSRNSSFAGQKMAERLAADLGAAGIAVVSGLARGIDTAAHRASLKTGTIAILAGGLDKPYPPDNLPLFEAIADAGALVSEMPFGWEPRGRDFPRRNRIISGLCYATIVVEAAPKSGSLITARFAHEQGREVFAVPGSPLDPRAEGTNDLIFKGEARLCRSTADVVETIAPMLESGLIRRDDLFGEDPAMNRTLLWDEWSELIEGEGGNRQPARAPEIDLTEGMLQEQGAEHDGETLRRLLLEQLSDAPINLDDVARLAGARAQSVRSIALELELEGKVSVDEGGRLRRATIP